MHESIRRLLPSRYACHLPLGERLFVSSIIAQIGRENNISAENYVSRTVEDAGPYNLVNILMRMSLRLLLLRYAGSCSVLVSFFIHV